MDAPKVPLSEIVGAIDAMSEECYFFVDPLTGDVPMIPEDIYRVVEREFEGDKFAARDRADWEEELLEVARLIAASEDDRFVGIPQKYDVIDEWRLMRDFAMTLEDDRAAEDILDAIQGNGTFRRFRLEIDRNGLREKWFPFRDAAFQKAALDWCKENNINVDESS